MTDSAIYCTLELPADPQVQDDSRLKPKADSHRPRTLSCLVIVALGLLTVILVSLLLCQWILCRGSKDSVCAHCPRCPDLWMRNGSHCYYFSVEKKDWNSSLEFCADKDSHFLTFPDDQKAVPFREHLGNDFYWIGLRYKDVWRWEDGSVLSFRIQSNSLVQRCGTIHRTGLHASSCEVSLQWICKKTIH